MILTVIGTRPEAIKLAPLLSLLPRDRIRILLTGQHAALAPQALAEFGLQADGDLALMEKGQRPEGFLARALAAIGADMEAHPPRLVLVHGDTVSALGGGLAAFYRQIPLFHVEAGLRSGRMDAPFPEEMHRRTLSLLATRHYAPTAQARDRLLAEGISPDSILVTGNTVIDALKSTLCANFDHPILAHPYLFLTAHRRENHHGGLDAIFQAARMLLEAHPTLHLLCPLHPHPRVQQAATVLEGHPRAHLTGPLSTHACHNLLSRAALVLTDSGGIQEEAVALGRPVLVLRAVTERYEALGQGLTAVGTDPQAITAAAEPYLAELASPPSLPDVTGSVFGDGRAAERIRADLAGFMGWSQV